MPPRRARKPTIAFLGAGAIGAFATSYRCLALARCLARDYDAEVHFVAAANADDQRTYGDWHHGVRLHYVDDLPILLTGWRCDPQLLLRTLVRVWRRCHAVWRLKPDLVHVFKPLPETLLAGVALRCLGVRVVLDDDDADADMMVANGHAQDGWRYAMARVFSRIGHRLCHAVTVASRAFEREYRRRGCRATYVPNGVFLDDFAARTDPPVRPTRDVVALYLGALERCFDVDVALDAFAHARERCPALRLLVVGDGPLRGALEARADALGCRHAVEFVGRVPKDEVIDWLNRAHVVLFPMRDTWLNRCRCPLKLREFAATGRPLIAPAFGEVLEAAQSRDDLVDPGAGPEAYGRKLASLAEDLLQGTRPPRRRSIPRSLDWGEPTSRLVETYRTVLGRDRFPDLSGKR